MTNLTPLWQKLTLICNSIWKVTTLKTLCDYYIEDIFVKNISKIQEQKRALSMFHMNTKSLPKHFDELQQYLHMLEYDFSAIGISETWLNYNNADLYDLNGYVTINGCRKQRRGSGVSLYIRGEISVATRNDLGYSDSEMESILIGIDKDIFRANSNIAIGLIYRMPDSSVDICNGRIWDILNTVCKEHKIFYCIGDLNVDFFKYDVHKHTSAILDTTCILCIPLENEAYPSYWNYSNSYWS